MFRCNHHHHNFLCLCVPLFGMRLIPNSATTIHQKGPNNICSHTTELTTPMYFNSVVWLHIVLGPCWCLYVRYSDQCNIHTPTRT
jgi:hypothetical protein